MACARLVLRNDGTDLLGAFCMVKSNIYLSLLPLLLSACSLDFSTESLSSGSSGAKSVVAVDSTGVTLTGVKASEVVSVEAEGSTNVFGVEAAGDGIKLVPKRNVSLIAGVVYEILVKTANASVTYTIQTDIPTGAIMPFNASSCPDGWSVFNDGRGRVLVGAGAGNTDADGTALTSRTLGATGGREFTTGIPAVTLDGQSTTPSPTANLAVVNDGSGSTFIGYRNAAANTTLSGQKADSNMMPYSNILYCQKD